MAAVGYFSHCGPILVAAVGYFSVWKLSILAHFGSTALGYGALHFSGSGALVEMNLHYFGSAGLYYILVLVVSVLQTISSFRQVYEKVVY